VLVLVVDVVSDVVVVLVVDVDDVVEVLVVEVGVGAGGVPHAVVNAMATVNERQRRAENTLRLIT